MGLRNQVKTEQRRLQVGSTTVRYEIAGAGKPIILVHGLAGSTRWWTQNIDVLAAYFQVYLVDLSGFGSEEGRSRFVLNQAASFLAQWMDSLQLERANIIGHSMGGRIAAEFAATFPQRVERLVLVAPAILPFGRGYTKQSWGMVQAIRRVPVPVLRMALSYTLRTGIIPVLNLGRKLFTTDILDKLAQIQASTLLIWGEYDTVVPVAVDEILHQHLHNYRFAVLKGAGHVPMWEKAEEFNSLMLDFLLDP
ncbi:MAG: alpha/beta fold hydrolase [Chloroflexi bacterium]|nr:alpha/beta fold hydrolase [Chloroflexota bacterium]